jgi:O-antigen ligase
VLYPKQTIGWTLVVLAIVYLLSSSVLEDEIAWASERLTAETSVEDRIIGNNASIEMIKAKPLFGWGYGNYDLFDRLFRTRVADIPARGEGTSHNTYLTIMAETGLMTLFLLIFPVGYWLLASRKAWRWLPHTGFWSRSLLIVLWLVILDHVIVSNFMDMIRFNQFGTTVFWMVLALIATVVYPHLSSRGRTEPTAAVETLDRHRNSASAEKL